MGIVVIVSASSMKVFIKLEGVNGDQMWRTSWLMLSVGVNLLVTGLVCHHIWRAQRNLSESLSTNHVRPYLGIVAILIESSLPFTMLGIASSVFAGLGIYGEEVADENLSRAWFVFCALSPQLIIFRVVTDRAWAKDLKAGDGSEVLSQSIHFAHSRVGMDTLLSERSIAADP